jgi:hypothetical protein
MTVFDLLFIALFLAAVGTLLVAAVSAVRGRRARALAILRRLAICTVAYLGVVYMATALPKQVVLRVGDPQCSDDWCIAVERVKRTPKNALMLYEVTLRIFQSRPARGAARKRCKRCLSGERSWEEIQSHSRRFGDSTEHVVAAGRVGYDRPHL